MRILVFGKKGQLASEFFELLKDEPEVCFLGSDEINFHNPDVIRSSIHKYKPEVIINTSAYTAVDKAESEMESAQAVNVTAVSAIGEEAYKLNTMVIHFSTDYIFDGTKTTAYLEEDRTHPINVYGQTKLDGERALIASKCFSIIIRVSWIYGKYGNNFLKTMLQLGRTREELKIVSDQIGAPTWSHDIARAVLVLLKDPKLSVKSGVYHLNPQGQTSWYEFAKKIFELEKVKNPNSLVVKSVLPITTAEYKTPASRPLFSKLNSEKILKEFSIQLPHWEESLIQFMKNN